MASFMRALDFESWDSELPCYVLFVRNVHRADSCYFADVDIVYQFVGDISHNEISGLNIV